MPGPSFAGRCMHDFVLLDGTLAECDRVGDSRADYSAKRRRHGVQGVPVGRFTIDQHPERDSATAEGKVPSVIRLANRPGSRGGRIPPHRMGDTAAS